jgi:hypothetical protein
VVGEEAGEIQNLKFFLPDGEGGVVRGSVSGFMGLVLPDTKRGRERFGKMLSSIFLGKSPL